MSFLPQGYKAPASASNYLKLVKGGNRFRVLGSAIVGWQDWTADKKPIRSRVPMTPIDASRPIKHFWAFPCWDYATKAIKILEITQRTIQQAIETLSLNADWGDPCSYDITVKREGEGMETEYSVVPIPPKPLDPEIARLLASTKINLDALYDGGDPFADNVAEIPKMTEPVVTPDDGEIKTSDIPF